jgi:hypothetical protein
LERIRVSLVTSNDLRFVVLPSMPNAKQKLYALVFVFRLQVPTITDLTAGFGEALREQDARMAALHGSGGGGGKDISGV